MPLHTAIYRTALPVFLAICLFFASNNNFAANNPKIENKEDNLAVEEEAKEQAFSASAAGEAAAGVARARGASRSQQKGRWRGRAQGRLPSRTV